MPEPTTVIEIPKSKIKQKTFHVIEYEHPFRVIIQRREYWCAICNGYYESKNRNRTEHKQSVLHKINILKRRKLAIERLIDEFDI